MRYLKKNRFVLVSRLEKDPNLLRKEGYQVLSKVHR